MSSSVAHGDSRALEGTTDREIVQAGSLAHASLWLGGTLILALLLYYFVGIDQGATSVFGDDMHVHEYVHDARHFLGFPCH